MISLTVCTPHPLLFGLSNREELDGRGMWLVWVRREACTGFWWGNLTEGDHLGDTNIDGSIMLNESSVSGMWGYGLDRAGSG